MTSTVQLQNREKPRISLARLPWRLEELIPVTCWGQCLCITELGPSSGAVLSILRQWSCMQKPQRVSGVIWWRPGSPRDRPQWRTQSESSYLWANSKTQARIGEGRQGGPAMSSVGNRGSILKAYPWFTTYFRQKHQWIIIWTNKKKTNVIKLVCRHKILAKTTCFNTALIYWFLYK